MTKKRISQIYSLQALALACLVGTFSSCAGKSDVTGESDAPTLPVSEASLLSDSEKVDSSQSDSSIFADLDPAKEKKDAEASASIDASSGPFYNAIGGESLGRVAYTLYGDRSFRKQLLEKNSGLSSPKSLASGQPVYFDFSDVKPQPTYLTKDLLDRYPNELSEKLKAVSASAQGTVTLQPGETLQKLSERLYGTTRYWTELYLLNHDKIPHYDKVRAGMILATNEHGAVAPVAEETVPAPVAETRPVSPAEPAMNTQAAPVAQPAVMDPIPETPEPEAAPAPAPMAHSAAVESLTTPPSTSILDVMGESGSANLRRIVYVLLIVGIGGLAFYFTRPSRKQKIDMLDVTTGSTAPPSRSKLGTKESSRKSIG